jgi:hypothetical protein
MPILLFFFASLIAYASGKKTPTALPVSPGPVFGAMGIALIPPLHLTKFLVQTLCWKGVPGPHGTVIYDYVPAETFEYGSPEAARDGLKSARAAHEKPPEVLVRLLRISFEPSTFKERLVEELYLTGGRHHIPGPGPGREQEKGPGPAESRGKEPLRW